MTDEVLQLQGVSSCSVARYVSMQTAGGKDSCTAQLLCEKLP